MVKIKSVSMKNSARDQAVAHAHADHEIDRRIRHEPQQRLAEAGLHGIVNRQGDEQFLLDDLRGGFYQRPRPGVNEDAPGVAQGFLGDEFQTHERADFLDGDNVLLAMILHGHGAGGLQVQRLEDFHLATFRINLDELGRREHGGIHAGHAPGIRGLAAELVKTAGDLAVANENGRLAGEGAGGGGDEFDLAIRAQVPFKRGGVLGHRLDGDDHGLGPAAAREQGEGADIGAEIEDGARRAREGQIVG